ncbi:tRNA uridine-5-carboxymethylaminomethyl(34) synthesis GTPase MnmE [Sphingosinicella sp. LHD-64]|uniref:tRNA uridine-5-carboxymethylaminomethyl(34) synthesis GTPase MnmE n=1 Tax=Sphingosinicella sp. LHD-64 TaxID=3072139 RepID=UPI00280EEE7A|nr:tRNA uridine-5-carboxymethylaminomethyl(34) synthesis GTPase MnmE [Sphingosinicella sp. LHD-64]MDQ8757031.1 tRNA uridine-5-carboxymethylaminomethyl(34) synthesis GTPase MnmE [Sphingosinicella sp. LHD-64]
MTDTIYALSSGAPPAAIAVVRISGPRADAALETLAGTLPAPRTAKLAILRDDDEVLDNALILRFPGPQSATGEDVAELHLHGGRSVVAAVLAALAQIDGLRAAEPGEFTRRAFECGRIDLAEAEGLADLLSAETESQRRAALALAGGALSRQVETWRQALLAVAARIEAVLDFSDEGDVDVAPNDFAPDIAALADEIDAWLARPSAERLRDGVRVVIAGPPNSGKSSLINALAGREAAIISDIPGTTRDVIEVPVAIGGTPFLLADTAGLRASGDAIETIGVERARGSIAAADILLWLGDPDACPAPARTILVQPKADLLPPARRADVIVSAVTGQGLDDLAQELRGRASRLLPAEGEVALNARHRAALADLAGWLREGQATSDPLIVAEAMRQARVALDRITGRAGVEDMLDALFSRFCIGK